MERIIKKYWKEAVAGVVFLAAYTPAILWMWGRWFARDSYYSHGIIVPLFSIYLIWQIKDELKKIERSSSAFGIQLIVLGFIIYCLSAMFRVYFTSAFSMMIVFIGLLLHFYGNEIFKKIAFPIAFLFFMVPLPMVVVANITFKMKIFAAQIATVLLNEMGIPALRAGSIIKMRHSQVVVDDVCSGLRSLISLLALGSIFAYWLKSTKLKRILLFLATIPIAVITNVCRVMFLSTVTEVWGAEYTKGAVHTISGLMVYALACILLYVTRKLIE